ncbi:uncharacterized protein LOC119683965 [Teleopsis dalmanni]|uniref:uncharacterized protein LOC119683965 n=1 Tax=Teleopsis dalmanni TaxID=139649 RepID=UPI0018CE6FCF|nr:uncharacterized protein LOC119683965 [Teleopsis dalmanni]
MEINISIELFTMLYVIHAVFIFLWLLIFGDFKNFKGSRSAYSSYTALDPINCYQNFQKKVD